MKLIDAITSLRDLDQTVLQTRDVMAYLQINKSHATKLLTRLAQANHLIKIKRGLWAFADKLDPLALPQYLVAPFPCYISLYSALYYHGMISQIPTVVFAVSLARTRQFNTPLCQVSIHHVNPQFYFGFEAHGTNNILMATPEKTLIDVLYFSSIKSRISKSLPEVTFPESFSTAKAKKMIEKIMPENRQIMVAIRFNDIMARAKKAL